MLFLAASLALLSSPSDLPDMRPSANAAMAKRPLRNVGMSVRMRPITEGPPIPKIQGPRNSSRPLIVIDPGHGGHDPGARNVKSGTLEKDVTLAVAMAMRDELLKSGRVRIALTREDDSFLALEERFGLARDMGAALFISIHADASEETGAHGATIYTLSDVASDAEAERLAARENRANVLGGVDLSNKSSAVSSILIDLMQRETMTSSARFAELLHRETAPSIAFRSPWNRRAALVVLRAPDTPSILFETGYISNDAEAEQLRSVEGRRKLAEGAARAIAIYAATLDKSGQASQPR
ncbi:MAG: N-acetylmuramoyl-L-alanine amidase [Sphingobium sp.]|nr:N-acetylmuramoyl-L-alanine amidase [Sphingobium sp.]